MFTNCNIRLPAGMNNARSMSRPGKMDNRQNTLAEKQLHRIFPWQKEELKKYPAEI